ncbi:MAG: 4-hydroxy-3-methylbut-2-enyl diphosphate reductase [Patescibacteria group bacterium]
MINFEKSMEIQLSKFASFCKGVQIAFDKAEEVAKSAPRPLYMLGDLVNNKEVVRRFEEKGIKMIESLDEIKSGTLIITAHGISPKLRRLILERGINIVDTTCFGVNVVHLWAKRFAAEGRRVIIVGKKDHREVLGVMEEIEKPIVITDLEEVKKINLSRETPIGVVSQTTFKVSKFKKIAAEIKKKFSDVKIQDTICCSTHDRQEDVRQLARQNEVAIVIGDPKSSNSVELYNTAREVNPNSYFIATAAEIKSEWFKGKKTVCIATGASTPKWIINETIEKIKVL